MKQSIWATYSSELYGKTSAPSDITNFNMIAQSDQAYLKWDTVSDLDVIHGGNYWIRYTSNLTGATWAGSTDVTKTIPGSASSTSVSLMSGTYLIKAIDSSGNQSNNATLISSNTADILNLNNVYTTIQHPSFGTSTADSGMNDSRTSNIYFDPSSNVIQLSASSIKTGTTNPYLVSSSNEYHADYWLDTASGTLDTRSGSLDDTGHVTNKLQNDNASFSSSYLGYNVYNVDTGNIALITNIDSSTVLTLDSDIFDGTGDVYKIQVLNSKLRDTTGSFSAATHKNKLVRNLSTGDVAEITSVDNSSNLTLSSNIFGQTSVNYRIEGDIDSEGYYYFTDKAVDLGAIYNSRVTVAISSTSMSSLVLFEGTTGLFDSKSGLFDGSDISDATSIAQVRGTLDNPSDSSASWNPWSDFHIGDYYARGLEFRVKLSSSNTSHLVKVDVLKVTVDMPDTVKSGYSIESSPSGLASINYGIPYKTVPTVGITMQNSITGDYFIISSSTVNGFTVNFYNSSGTATQKTFNWISSGY